MKWSNVEVDWVNRVDSILQKVFLRESVVPNVSTREYLKEIEFLSKIRKDYYGETKLLTEQIFRIHIFIFAYLVKGIYRQHKLDSGCQTDAICEEDYQVLERMLEIFTCEPFGVAPDGNEIMNIFSKPKVVLLEENVWKRFPFACCVGVKCLCSVYDKLHSRFLKRTCLRVLQTAVKLACLKNGASSGVILNDGNWLQVLRCFITTTISSFRLQHYHDLFAKCIQIIIILSRNGYDLGEEVRRLLQQKLQEYPRKQIPASVWNLFQNLQKYSVQSQSILGKRDVLDIKEPPISTKRGKAT